MELQNKKINFLGDSITEGVGTSSEDKIYLNLLKEKCGLAYARNYGIGGTRIARQKAQSAEEIWDRDFCLRLQDMDSDANVIVVFGGTNDYGHGDAPLGAFEDRTPETFFGACHFLMQGLIEKYPTAQIVIMTPLHREDEDTQTPDLKTYVDIIKQTAEYYSIPVLDLFASSGMQPKIPIIKEKYVPDGLHPNDNGHEIIAHKLEMFLKNL